MPVYVYQCKNCNHVFEQRLPAVRRRNPAQALQHRRCDLQGLRLLQHRQGKLLNGSSTPAKNEGRGNTGCPAPRRLRSTPDSDALHDIVTPVRGTLLTHPFQTLTLLRGQRLHGSSRSLRTRFLGVLVLLGVLALSISFLHGSPRSRRGTRSNHRRRGHAHQQRLSPAHRAAAAHTAVTAARLRRRRIASHEPQRPHPYPGSAARAPPQRPDQRTPPGCPA